jgi:hypothetical protein
MKTYLLLVVLVIAGLLNQSYAQSPDEIVVQKKGLGFAYYLNGREISKNELLYVLEGDPDAERMIKKSHRNIFPGKVLRYAGTASLGLAVGTYLTGGSPSWAAAGIGAALVFVSLPFTGAVLKREQQAIYTYNGAVRYASKPKVDMTLGYEQHGATLKINF